MHKHCSKQFLPELNASRDTDHPFHPKQPLNIHFLLWAEPRGDADIEIQLTSWP